MATTSPDRPAPDSSTVLAWRPTANMGIGTALAVGLGAVAFVAGGGTDLGPNTWVEIAVMVIGVSLAIAAVVWSAPGRAWGSGPLLLFAALTVFTAASIAWSVQPADSWVEANRSVSYLAAFGGAMALARIAPRRWSGIAGALAAFATVISSYALLTKVFPATFDAGDPVGRLRLPFDYANAVGLVASMGVPACLWAGSRREGSHVSRVLCVPALGILGAAIVLSLSRGAFIFTAVGLVFWFAVVPGRLRAAVPLCLGALGAGAVSAWALETHALIDNNIGAHARTVAGHQFGLVLLAMLVCLTGAGVAAALLADRVELTEITRRRLGLVLVVLASLIPIAGIGAVAASHRGLTGTISNAWTQLTSPNSGGAAAVPGRLVQLGSSRGRYWNEALRVGEHALLKGSGADGFATAGTRYTVVPTLQSVEHAHSYALQTFADLGLIGVALSIALLVAWAVAARRAVGTRGPWIDDHQPERNALLTLLAVVIVYGLGSATDWVWFIPGATIPALVCAGWLAGRGPLVASVGTSGKARLTPTIVGVGTIAAAVTLFGGWMIVQPLRSANGDAAALSAAVAGDQRAAIARAQSAATDDPVSVDPLFELAALKQAAGDKQGAFAEYQKATSIQPDNPHTWLQLGGFLLDEHRPAEALAPLRRALNLYLGWPDAVAAIDTAEAELKQGR